MGLHHPDPLRHGSSGWRHDDADHDLGAQTLNTPRGRRGTTLLNITQQVASSIGVAIFSVILTNASRPAARRPGRALPRDPPEQGSEAAQASSRRCRSSGSSSSSRPATRRPPSRPSGAGGGGRGRRVRAHLLVRRRLRHPDARLGRVPAAQARGVAPPRGRDATRWRPGRHPLTHPAPPCRCGPAARGAGIGHAGGVRPGTHNAITDVEGVLVGHATATSRAG